MGQLKDKKIDIIRSWDDPNKEPVPEYDYTAIYPVSTYEAIHKTMDDESTTLETDLNAIHEAIESKQDILNGGTPGNLMVWGVQDGEIGEMEVVKTINPDDTARSYQKATSERAVGKALDLKANVGDLNAHKSDMASHVTEEEKARWNSMASGEAMDEHIQNLGIHVTLEDKERWNEKADASSVTEHIGSTSNPHHVTAHQTGTYSSSELDTMFSSIRESFFNFENIHYDVATDTATLGENNEEGYNPDYVLGYGSDLPTPIDDSLTYFAIRPVTDYSTNLSNEAIIYIKEPTRNWREVGIVEVADGDMVIRKADSAMCVWLEGRFMILDAITAGGSGGSSDLLWRPIVSAEGVLSFVRSTEITPPDPVDIKGPAGYTPQKGVDYFDGADGIGIPEGGEDGQVVVKTSGFDYDTQWMSFREWLDTYVDPSDLPQLLAAWDNIQGKPEIYQDLGDDDFGLISQKATTAKFVSIDDAINEINVILGGAGGVSGLIDKLNQHLMDYANPHRISASQIGAVSNETFLTHSMNRSNPHNVTADQIGLGNVSNTSDADKPISIATQEALNTINTSIEEIRQIIGGDKMITSVEWDEPNMTLIFGYADGEILEVKIPITDIFEGMYWDSNTSELVFPLPDGTEKRIAITDLITEYTGGTSANIQTTISNEGVITSEIIPESIDGTVLAQNINLRGNPTAVTQTVDNKSNRIATTEFVKKATVDNLTSYDSERPLSANMGRVLNAEKTTVQDVLNIIGQTPLTNVIDNLYSDDPSAALSANMGRYLNVNKADKVHTSIYGATYGRSSANLFGHSRASSDMPLMDGEGDVGTDDGFFARGNHRHPTDTSRAPLHWDEESGLKMTGYFQAETPPADANDDRVATTKWVLDSGLVPSKTMIMEHKQDFNNPHHVSADQLGLGTVLDDIATLREEIEGHEGVEPIPDEEIISATIDAWNNVIPYGYALLAINYTGPDNGQFVAPNTYFRIVEIGDDYSVNVPVIENYIPNVSVVSGTMTDGGVSVTVNYRFDGATLIIDYVGPDDGLFEAPSAVMRSYRLGESYSIDSPSIEYYTPDIATVSGTIDDDTVIEVTYTRNTTTLRINYIGPENDPDWVDIPTYEDTYYAGTDYSITSPIVQNYTADRLFVSGLIGNDDITETVHYTRNKGNLTISYEGTPTDIPDDVIEYNVGDNYSVDVPVIEGYTSDISVINGTMVDGGVNVTVTYTRTIRTLTINYVGPDNDSDWVDIPSYEHEYYVGDSYSVTSPEVMNYDASKVTVSGTMPDENITETVVYTHKKALLRITYVGADNNPPTYSQEYNVGDSYSIASPTITNYSPDIANVSGIMNEEGVDITVTYTRNTAVLRIIYAGPSGDTSFPTPETVVQTVNVGDTYSVTSPTVSGYTPNKTVVSGTMTSDGVTEAVTYTAATATLTIHYINDNTGGKLFDDYVGTYNIGQTYSVTSPSKPGSHQTIGNMIVDISWEADKAVVTGTMVAGGVEETVRYTQIVNEHEIPSIEDPDPDPNPKPIPDLPIDY